MVAASRIRIFLLSSSCPVSWRRPGRGSGPLARRRTRRWVCWALRMAGHGAGTPRCRSSGAEGHRGSFSEECSRGGSGECRAGQLVLALPRSRPRWRRRWDWSPGDVVGISTPRSTIGDLRSSSQRGEIAAKPRASCLRRPAPTETVSPASVQACLAASGRTENRVVPYSCTPIAVRETIGPARVVLARPLKLGATEDSTCQPNRLGA